MSGLTTGRTTYKVNQTLLTHKVTTTNFIRCLQSIYVNYLPPQIKLVREGLKDDQHK